MGARTLQQDLKAAFAEFLALTFFVYFGAGSVTAAVAADPTGPVQPINYAAAFGFSITLLAYSIADLSGGHMNPAVTVTLMITKNVELRAGVLYIIAQFLGGILGGALLLGSVGEGAYKSGIGMLGEATATHEATTCGQGLLLEFMGTLVLLFTVYHVAVWASSPDKNDLSNSMVAALAPIPIGLSVFVAHLVLGPFTGCGINPARVLGAVIFEKDFFDGHAGGDCFWIYFVGPLLASLVAPLLYRALYGSFVAGVAAVAQPAVPTFSE